MRLRKAGLDDCVLLLCSLYPLEDRRSDGCQPKVIIYSSTAFCSSESLSFSTILEVSGTRQHWYEHMWWWGFYAPFFSPKNTFVSLCEADGSHFFSSLKTIQSPLHTYYVVSTVYCTYSNKSTQSLPPPPRLGLRQHFQLHYVYVRSEEHVAATFRAQTLEPLRFSQEFASYSASGHMISRTDNERSKFSGRIQALRSPG